MRTTAETSPIGEVHGFQLRPLAACDLDELAADLDCPSLRERMCYHDMTLRGHLAVQQQRSQDLVFVVSDEEGFFGVCGLLAYRDGVEAAIYLHDRRQGQGLARVLSEMLVCAALQIGHHQVWVSTARDNRRSQRAIAKHVPGAHLESGREDASVRPSAPRMAELALVELDGSLSGSDQLTDGDRAQLRLVIDRCVALTTKQEQALL